MPTVGFSGGKDSTILLEMACMIAKERGLPPVKAVFLDQGVEATSNIEFMRTIIQRPATPAPLNRGLKLCGSPRH